ncbi:rhodopsin, G0-coupled-like [Branchiostoma lanceolatum]|uniref:rhodopsin, G0-coupled-like n=1 Tax=Branchiostoma lanceolatum TaxID=7740 RepID=UPI003454AD69
MTPANNTTEASEWSPAELGVSATVMGVYLTIVGLVATVGNATVVLLFILKWRQLCRKAPNLLIINLAAADLCITIFGYPFSASSGYAHQWLFSDAICTMYGFSCFLLSMVSMHTLCLISVHRYITICRPEHASQLTMNRTILAVVGAWLYALTMAIPPLFNITRYKQEPFGLSCTIDFHVTSTADLVYLGVLIVLGYVINVAVMGYCYFKIVRKFSKHRFRDVRDIRTSNQHSFERGVTLRCILMTLLYLISWTPYTALAIWTMVGPPPPVEVGLVAALTAKTHCAFNPILYTLMSEVYRKLVLRTMCPCCFNRIGGNLARAPAEDSRHSGNPDIFTVAYSSREQAVHIRNPRRFCFVMETASENLGIDDEVFTGQIVPCSRLKTGGPSVEGLGGPEVTQRPSVSGSERSLSLLLDVLPKRRSSSERAASSSVRGSHNTVSSSSLRQTTCHHGSSQQPSGRKDTRTRQSHTDGKTRPTGGRVSKRSSSHSQQAFDAVAEAWREAEAMAGGYNVERQPPTDTKPTKCASESLGGRPSNKCSTDAHDLGGSHRYMASIKTSTGTKGRAKDQSGVRWTEVDDTKLSSASKTSDGKKTSKTDRTKRTVFGMSRKHAYIVD